MSKITEIMNLIEFPEEAAKFFEEVYAKVENDKDLTARLDELENQYFESFNSEDLEAKLTSLSEASGYSKYTIDMLLSVYACVRLRKMYHEKGYTDEFFAHNMKDLTYKLDECKKLHDVWGTFVFPWFAGFYKMERFALGRLQYEPRKLKYDYKDMKKDEQDTLNMHIPNCGPLTPESVQESLRLAYDFFGPNCGDKLVFMCHSWLLYSDAIDLWPQNSNTRKFYDIFDIIQNDEEPNDFDIWRIFYKNTKNLDELPRETSLQKNYYEHFKNGKHMGNGFGVIVYKP